MESDESQIRQLVEDWREYTKRGDVDRVLSLMTDDALFLVAGREPMSKGEFETTSRNAAGLNSPQLAIYQKILELTIDGELATMISYLEVTVTPPGTAAPIFRKGNAMTIFRKLHGRWFLSRDANLLSRVDSPK